METKQVLENINSWLNEIENCINEKVDVSVPDNIMGKLSELSPLLALSSQTVSLSEKVLNIKMGELVENEKYKNLTPTDKKYLFSAKAADEKELTTRADRLNSALVHCIDSYRSALSFLKEEYKDSKYHNQK